MAYIFLSHSHADKPTARLIAAELRNFGHSVWIDEAEINIGDSLIAKIREGLGKVDFVCALISEQSVKSEWVTRELDIASTREIDEKKVIVLPVLLSEVDLPGFLKGKFYADLKDPARLDEVATALNRAVGGGDRIQRASEDDVAGLSAALTRAREQLSFHERQVQRAEGVAFEAKSDALKKKIIAANEKHPSHAPINNVYAFTTGSIHITLDYVLWAIAKAQREGSHPLEIILTLDNKWGRLTTMLEAYSDMLDQH